MHQTFYIDVDEEISSVIDRLRKSMAVENYFVVPKRALFIQSIVNLKLLKREAEKLKKEVILVTQDEVAASMAVRSGIEVRGTLDSVDVSDEHEESVQEEYEEEMSPPKKPQELQQKKIRLRSVGSTTFYDADGGQRIEHVRESHHTKIHHPHAAKTVKVHTAPNLHSGETRKKAALPNQVHVYGQAVYHKHLDPNKEQKIERIFHSPQRIQENHQEVAHVSSKKIRSVIVGFVGMCVVVLVGVGAFLFVPSAHVLLTPNVSEKKIDIDVQAAGSSGSIDSKVIPLRTIDSSQSLTLQYDASGKGGISGKKATGSVVIYNEYSNQPQTLIAGTRIATQDGKIFHLQKQVIVPGFTVISGETKPGAIETDVIADTAGSDYNVDPTTFTIPGFQGGPKYDKFYAKSSKPMTGGASDGDQVAASSVSQTDIDNAKTKTETAIKLKINDEIKSQLGQDEVVLDQAIKYSTTNSQASVKAGANAQNFDYSTAMNAHVLVFSRKDIEQIITKSLEGNQEFVRGVKTDITKIEYGGVDANFDTNTISMKVHAEIEITPQIDVNSLKNEILGKDESQLETIIRKYPAIKNANVEFVPSFVNRVPQYSQRVSIEIGH